MKKSFVLFVLLLAIIGFTTSGCVKRTIEPIEVEVQTPPPPPNEPIDALEEALTTKKEGYRYRVLKNLLNGGKIVKRTINLDVEGDNEISKEEWVLQDRGGNKHIVLIKNGKLRKISEYKDQTQLAEPVGGWQD